MSLRRRPEPVVTAGLIVALAIQNAVPPFATDMYSPAFPQVTADLRTSASAVGLTLTAFFIGMALGQLVGGAVSDQRGRRGPMILGGLVCTLGALVCAFAPSIGVLMLGRVLQGLGGGAASAPTSVTCSPAPSPASRCSPTSPPRPSSSRGSRG